MTAGGRKLRPGPVEPGAERFDIGGVDGRAAPDAQARRGIAIAGDIMGRPFGVEQPRELLDEVRIGAFDREAHAGLRADAAIDREMAEPRPCGDDLVERGGIGVRSEEHTSELQSLVRISYAVFCLKKKIKKQ